MGELRKTEYLCDPLSEKLLELFRRKGLTFGAAESCTGGLINCRLTAVPGSSDVVFGGVVSYSNSVKMKLLNVKSETLAAFGAVSENTALEMAVGVRGATGADICVSVTGIAGPGGGTAEKPVGTVCFGIASPVGTKTTTKHFDCHLSRDEIRRLAADFALTLAISVAEQEVPNA